MKADYSVLLDPILGAKDFREGRIGDPSMVGIRVKDDNILEVELTEPAAHFIKVLAHHSLSPVFSGNLLNKQWSPRSGIVGNGAFKIVSITDEEITLEKNKYYWDTDNVKLPGIKMIFSDTPAQSTNLFNYGKADWIISGIDFDTLLSPKYIEINPEFAVSLFFFNNRQKPFDDPLVRSGLACILDWEKIRSLDRFNYPVDYLVPKLQGYPEREGIIEQDLGLGNKLLNEAGYALGKKLPEIVIRIGTNSIDRETAQIMKENWEEYLSVSVKIEEVEWSDYYDSLEKSDYTLGTINWVGDYGDPLTFLQLWEGNSNLNSASYNDEQYNALIRESMSMDGAERYNKLVEAEQLLLKQAQVLPINQPYAVNLIDTDIIDGWYPNLLDIHPFKFMEITAPDMPADAV